MHSLFEAKGIAGNIVHAVATTNAVIAGLIVIEAIKVLQDTKIYRFAFISLTTFYCMCFCFYFCQPFFVVKFVGFFMLALNKYHSL